MARFFIFIYNEVLTLSIIDNIIKLMVITIFDNREVIAVPRNQLQNLTEPMFYILLCLDVPRCGVEIMEVVQRISGGRVTIGPGTLYALLNRFAKEGILSAKGAAIGRKITYSITEKGAQLLNEEKKRLTRLLQDAETYRLSAQEAIENEK